MTRMWTSPDATALLDAQAVEFARAAIAWVQAHEPEYCRWRQAQGLPIALTGWDSGLQSLVNAGVQLGLQPGHTVQAIAHTVAKLIWQQGDQAMAKASFVRMVDAVLLEMNSGPKGSA